MDQSKEYSDITYDNGKKRYSSVHVTGREGPYGCERSRLPHILENRLIDGGKVSLTRRPSFTPQENSLYSFLLEAESTPGPRCGWED
jgi:hypothetical protein